MKLYALVVFILVMFGCSSKMEHAPPIHSVVTNVYPPIDTTKDKNIIKYRGGPVMTGAINIHLIWYGNFKDTNTKEIVTDFIKNLSGSPWYQIITNYYEISNGNTIYAANAVNLISYIDDDYSHGTSLTGLDIQNIISDNIDNHYIPLDINGLYFVLTSADVKQENFCITYCGWHSYFVYHDYNLKYSFVGDGSACGGCLPWDNTVNSPNDNIGADTMVSIMAHELAEAASDPNLNSWFTDSGAENADLCAWNFGKTFKVANGSSANMKLGSRYYLIQQNWVPDRVTGGYCGLTDKL